MDYKFEGWVAHDSSSAEGNMVWEEFEPKSWEETDIDIKITHSGVCGSDVHVLRSGWVIKFLLPASPSPMHYFFNGRADQALYTYSIQQHTLVASVMK